MATVKCKQIGLIIQTFKEPFSKARTYSIKTQCSLPFPEISNSSLTLDKYLAKHTSEDNASFEDIMKVSEEKHRQKHGWLYEAEKRHQQEQLDMLALEGPKSMKPIEGSSVTTWGYKNKNAVMYVPEGNEILNVAFVDFFFKGRFIVGRAMVARWKS